MADEADLFIIEHAGTMTTREMAELLGVNQSTVCRRAKKLGVSPGRRGRRGRRDAEPAPRREAPAAEGGDDWMERMVDLRSRLKAALDTCGDKDVARIAKEYRAVCDAIRREEGEDDGSSGFEGIIAMLS